LNTVNILGPFDGILFQIWLYQSINNISSTTFVKYDMTFIPNTLYAQIHFINKEIVNRKHS